MKRRVEWHKGRLNALIEALHEWPGRLVRAHRYKPQHIHGAGMFRAWNLAG